VKPTIHPVVLCGGSGTRLWPSSRRAFPKQFSPLLGDRSLYQATLARFAGPAFAPPVVVTHADFRFLAADQAAEAGAARVRILLEPVARNTSAAILSAALLLEDQPDALILVAPSDHRIDDDAPLLAAIEAGALAAAGGQLVTFGIRPDSPATGYGYLEFADPPRMGEVQRLKRFVEKPDAATAAAMLASGRYMWNAGIFLLRVADVTAAFRSLAPDIDAACRAAYAGRTTDLGFIRLAEAEYARAHSISVDYAIMEKAPNVSAVPVDLLWSDLGTWDAMWKASHPGAKGMVTTGNVTAIDCEGSLLRSEDESVALVGLGLKNVVAVAMRDAVLIADMDRSQDVRAVVDTLKARGQHQAEDYPRYHRPWGWYETLILGDRFQVKRIMVKPGGRLSLQSHVHRAEHWVVVQGTAKVTVGEKVTLLTENQSVYIPLGETHRMENPGKVPMYLIEVQTGSYLGEDDIIRYEDVYSRT
jgi:mannose-1-phosphate guanylyltransferase/mannose-1-phosphate guanylyltransferase/mannose-6-phosphate isomerase